ncbi:response regulator [bacterium]|nr:response regulator [bacterium]
MPPNDRLLIACEDPDLMEHIGRHTTEFGHNPRYAATLDQAQAEIDLASPDLIICSWRLGKLAGAELVQKLRRPQARTRFILLVEPNQRIDVVQATRQRIIAFLQFPYSPDDLARYIKAALDFTEAHANRREYNRYLFAVETHCILINPFEDSESRPIAAIIRDVSRSGMAMLVRQVMPVPAMLKVVLSINSQTQPVVMLAKSLSCTLTQIPDVYRLGAKFVGLLPKEFDHVLTELGRPDMNQADIFMGRSFKEAIADWLTHHKVELSAPESFHTPTVAEIAEQLFGEPTELAEPVGGNGHGRA